VDGVPVTEHHKRLRAVAGEQKADVAFPDAAAKLLPHQRFEIRLVVDDEDRRGHRSSPAPAPATGAIAGGKGITNRANLRGRCRRAVALRVGAPVAGKRISAAGRSPEIISASNGGAPRWGGSGAARVALRPP